MERAGERYSDRLTAKGVPCCSSSSTSVYAAPSPPAGFHHRPDAGHKPNSKLKAAFHKADIAIELIVRLLAA